MSNIVPTWLIIRIALVAVSGPIWLSIRTKMQDDFSAPPSWYMPLILITFSTFALIFLSVLRTDKDWVRPAWRCNPFDIDKPLEAFHLSGWSFLAGALTLLLFGLFQSPHDWAWVLPASLGVGVLLGVRLVSIPEHRAGT